MGRIPVSAIVLRGGRRPPYRLPGSICLRAKPFSSARTGRAGGAADYHKILTESLRARSELGNKAPHGDNLTPAGEPPSRVPCPVPGPHPAGHSGRRAPSSALRGFSPRPASQLPAPPPGRRPFPRQTPPPQSSSLQPPPVFPPQTQPVSTLPQLSSTPHSSSDQPRPAPPAPSSLPLTSEPPSPPPTPFPSHSFSNPGPRSLPPDSVTCPHPAPQPSPSLLKPRPLPLSLPFPAPLQLRLQPAKIDIAGWAPAQGSRKARRYAPGRGRVAAVGLCGSGRCLEGDGGSLLQASVRSLTGRMERTAGSGPGLEYPNLEAGWTEGVYRDGGWGPGTAPIQGRGWTGRRSEKPPSPLAFQSFTARRPTKVAHLLCAERESLPPSRLLTPIICKSHEHIKRKGTA